MPEVEFTKSDEEVAAISGVEPAQARAEAVATDINPDVAIGNLAGGGGAGDAETPPPIAVTSDEADTADEETGAAVTTAESGLNQRSEDAYGKAFDLLDDMAERSEGDRITAISNIENQRNISRADTAIGQRMEKGEVSTGLARMGGYLGGSGSTTAYMQSLSSSHRLEVAKMEAAYAAAIEAAKVAHDQKDMDLANSLMTTASNYATAINAKRQTDMNLAIQAQELQALERESDLLTLDAWAAQGYTVESIPDGIFNEMDKSSNRLPGTSRGLFVISQKDRELKDIQNEAERAKAELDLQTSLIDTLSKLRPNEAIAIGDKMYFGRMIENEFQGYEIDKPTGNITSVYKNQITGEVSFTTHKGVLSSNVDYDIERITGKDGSEALWYIDPSGQNAAVPVIGYNSGAGAGINTKTLMTTYPQGEVPQGTLEGWCLEFLRDLVPDGTLGVPGEYNSLEEKRALVDEDITIPKIGDVIISNDDANYGHVSIITDIRTNPEGQRVAIVTESNYKQNSEGKGIVTHDRAVVLEDENMEENGGSIIGYKRTGVDDALSSQGQQLISYPEGAADADFAGAESWAKNVIGGIADIQNVPDFPKGFRTAVSKEIARLNEEGYDVPIDVSAIGTKARDARESIKNIDEALPNVNSETAGLGALSKIVPGSPAKTLQSQLTTIATRIGFEELQKMRDNSPTGGSLGQISEREGEWLQAAQANLDQQLDPDILTKNLNDIKMHYQAYVLSIYDINPDRIDPDNYAEVIGRLKEINNNDEYKELKAQYEDGGGATVDTGFTSSSGNQYNLPY